MSMGIFFPVVLMGQFKIIVLLKCVNLIWLQVAAKENKEVYFSF